MSLLINSFNKIQLSGSWSDFADRGLFLWIVVRNRGSWSKTWVRGPKLQLPRYKFSVHFNFFGLKIKIFGPR